MKVTDVMTPKRALRVTDVLTHPGNRCPDTCHIGLKMTKTVALECSVKAVTTLTGGLGKLLWENSIGCAVGARMLALETKLLDHEEAFIAGMLCPIGKAALAIYNGNEYQKLLESSVKAPNDISSLEMERFGITSEIVGAALLDKWKLGTTLVQAILHHRDLKNQNSTSSEMILTRIINISANFCDKMGIGRIACNEGIDVAKILAAHLLHLKPEQMQLLYEQFIRSYENDRDYYLAGL